MYILRKYNFEQKSIAAKREKLYIGTCIDIGIGIHWLNPLSYECDKLLHSTHC